MDYIWLRFFLANNQPPLLKISQRDVANATTLAHHLGSGFEMGFDS